MPSAKPKKQPKKRPVPPLIEPAHPPIIDHGVHEARGLHDRKSEPSSAYSRSSYSSSSSSTVRSLSKESSVTSSTSSASSSGNDDDWLQTQEGYQTLHEAEQAAIDRLSRDRELRHRRAYLKEQEEFTKFQMDQRKRHHDLIYTSGSSSSSSELEEHIVPVKHRVQPAPYKEQHFEETYEIPMVQK